MKKTVLAMCGILLFAAAGAQQQPQYTQYIINNYIINPALTGIENYTDVKLSHRHQWVGLQDAPVTTYFTIHKPLGKQDDRTTATSFEIPGENPRGHNYWEDYQAAKPHSGIGMKVINDRTGPLNRFAGYVSYAYHIGISPRTSISAGFEAGVTDISLDRNELDFGAANPVDPAVYNSGAINQLKPDFGAGIWVYSADYFIGVSAQQIVPQKIYFSDNKLQQAGKLIPHLFFTSGYRFDIDDDFSLLPSFMLKYVQPTPAQLDLNAKLQYRDLAWIGASYRIKDGYAGMLGINVSNTFNVSYAYDYTTTLLNTVSKGTHEIVLGFLIGNKYGDWCPRNVW
ncbi:MAG TPA: type IX secretion system membrane protein PorP/SprF [Chitinophagaceae bacterium]|jgi:type IX secretion system PorP/SprF family membrane protein